MNEHGPYRTTTDDLAAIRALLSSVGRWITSHTHHPRPRTPGAAMTTSDSTPDQPTGETVTLTTPVPSRNDLPAWAVPGARAVRVQDPFTGPTTTTEVTIERVTPKQVVLDTGERCRAHDGSLYVITTGDKWGPTVPVMPVGDPFLADLAVWQAEADSAAAPTTEEAMTTTITTTVTLRPLTADDFDQEVAADGTVVPLTGDEDGNWYAFGHVDPGAFVEVVNRFEEANANDGWDPDFVQHEWAVTVKTPETSPDGEWACGWVDSPDVPGAWPISVLNS